MIGSHNSFTYCKAKKFSYNTFSGYWRCQEKDIDQQYASGVRYFDVRVFKDGKYWRTCHGSVNFPVHWGSFSDIDKLFQRYENSIYRVILEKGSNEDEFKNEVTKASQVPGSKMVYAAIKSHWNTTADGIFNIQPDLVGYNYNMWDPDDNFLKNIDSIISDGTIKSRAQANNKLATYEMIVDPNTIYLYDYAFLS